MAVHTTMTKSRRPKSRSNYSAGRTSIAAFVVFVTILPIVWIVINSFRSSTDIFASLSPLSWTTLFPQRLTVANYVSLWEDGFFFALWISIVVTVLSIVIGLALTSTAAYALAVFRFPGRGIVFATIVIGFMLPFEALAIPLYRVFTDWGLVNTLTALVLPGIANGLAVFNLRQAFLGMPGSLREASLIDGASELKIYWSIYLPLNKAPMVNSAILLFLGQWTAYLWPLLIVNDPSLQVAALNLAGAFTENSSDFGYSFAGTVILSLLPAIVLIGLRRFFLDAGASEGEKG
jgi:ABC-type glycerol-3-phosphate transport system permease component